MPTWQSLLNLAATSDLSAYDCESVAVADTLQILLARGDRKILRTFPQTAYSLEQLLQD